MIRWLAWSAAALLGILVATILLLGRIDLAPLAARWASAQLGRPVAIGALHVTPGRWIAIELRAARLDNRPGGSPQPMASLGRLTAEVEAVSLLSGPLVLRGLALEGARLLLERGADGLANWKFGSPSTAGSGRAGFPTLLGARLSDGALEFRTSSGALLRARLDTLELLAPDAAGPLQLTAAGAYNDVPLTLAARLDSFTALRDAARPYGTDLRLASSDTTLRFEGGMTAPLELDGVEGALALVAPTPAVLLAIAGVAAGGASHPALQLAGRLRHDGALWQLSEATGRLDQSAITAAMLRLVEAPRGQADDVTLDLAFDRLDLNALLDGGQGGGQSQADLSLTIDPSPDTVFTARLTAGQVDYAALRASDMRMATALTPGRLAVEELSMTFQGARLQAKGAVVAGTGAAGHVTADVGVAGLEVQALQRMLSLGAVPLRGRADAQVAVVAEGATLNAAARTAHLSAVMAMNGGSIDRQAVEIASTDIRALFRTADGRSPVSCMVGVLDIRAGIGTVSPLRIRSAAGTIAGSGQFDLHRRQLDLTVSSESSTTGSYALDVPVRISGRFDAPSIRPAQWSAAGRAELAAADDIRKLLPALQPFARRSPCLAVGRRP